MSFPAKTCEVLKTSQVWSDACSGNMPTVGNGHHVGKSHAAVIVKVVKHIIFGISLTCAHFAFILLPDGL